MCEDDYKHAARGRNALAPAALSLWDVAPPCPVRDAGTPRRPLAHHTRPAQKRRAPHFLRRPCRSYIARLEGDDLPACLAGLFFRLDQATPAGESFNILHPEPGFAVTRDLPPCWFIAPWLLGSSP